MFKRPSHCFSEMFSIHEEDFKKSFSVKGGYCLKTPANTKPKCRSCGLCPSPEFKKETLSRSFQTTSSSMLYDYKVPTITSVKRIIYSIPKELQYQKKMVLNHFIGGKIITANTHLLPYLMGIASISEIGYQNKNNDYSGLHCFDMEFSKKGDLVLPDLSHFGITIKELIENPTKQTLLSIFTYETSSSKVNKLLDKVSNFQSNPVYSRQVFDRAGTTSIKEHYSFAKLIKLVDRGTKTLVVFVVEKEHPLEVLKSILRVPENKLITSGDLNRLALFIRDKTSLCSTHKLPILYTLRGENTQKCIQDILGL